MLIDIPVPSTISRAIFGASGICTTWPNTTCSINLGSIAVRAIISCTTILPRSTAGT
ncbi:Uncharacterised protein [Vibrio cholerae]|nr:Uncharacterised protein [Vibrio cholerae]